jgi:hypothetical protein
MLEMLDRRAMRKAGIIGEEFKAVVRAMFGNGLPVPIFGPCRDSWYDRTRAEAWYILGRRQE